MNHYQLIARSNKFLYLDIKGKLLKWGNLSDKQIEVAMSKLGKLGTQTSDTPKKSFVDLVKEIQNEFIKILRNKVENNV